MSITDTELEAFRRSRASKEPIIWIVIHPNGEEEEILSISRYDAISQVISEDSRYSDWTVRQLTRGQDKFLAHRKFPKPRGGAR